VFGILHVVPDEDNEQFSLPEWNRHAVLWEACTKIKFFKQFLRRKFLFRWRQNTKYSRFLKLKKQISNEIILAIPVYAEASLLVSKLVQEILDIQFMPKDGTLKVNIVQEFLDKEKGRVLSTVKSNLTSGQSVPATPASSRYSTHELVERANKRKQTNILKISYSLEKFMNTIFEIRVKSDKILQYFFV
jgi:hypothetical protein